MRALRACCGGLIREFRWMVSLLRFAIVDPTKNLALSAKRRQLLKDARAAGVRGVSVCNVNR